MIGIEIFLIIVGIMTLTISFFNAKVFEDDKEKSSFDNKFDDEIIQQKVNAAIDDIIDQKVESTEVKIEKILNEKIMTVGEYSENVISEIDKNHNEVMFLYGMLNDKEKEVKNTLIDIENIKKSIKKIEVENYSQSQVNTESLKENSTVSDKKDIEDFNNQAINKAEKNNGNNKNTSSKKSSIRNNSTKKLEKTNSTKSKSNGKNNNDKILELYKQDKEPMDIAKELKLGIGEVRLVIDLYKNRV